MNLSSLINNFLILNRSFLLVVLDYISLLFSLWVFHLFFEFNRFGLLPNESLPLWIGFLTFLFACQFVIFYVADLYDIPSRNKEIMELTSLTLLISLILLFTLTAVFCYWTKFALGRDVLLMALLLCFACSISSRLLLVQIFSPHYLALVKPIRCAFLGDGPLAFQTLSENNFKKYFENYGFINPAEVSNLDDCVTQHGIESLIIDPTADLRLTDKQIDDLIRMKFRGIQIVEAGTFYEKLTSRVPLLHLPGSWFLHTQIFNEITGQAVLRAKRIFDIAVSLLLLLLTAPLIALTALLIKFTSKGPCFYAQRRIGLNGKVFVLYKLRSMEVNSEDGGPSWTKQNDPRVTSVGRFIRSIRVDELPQLWNVLRGDMSLIGPRPERPEFTETLRHEIPYYDLRHSVKPGLSGWAQVNEPLATPSDSLQKLEFDLFYIRHLSFWLELDIILKTIRVILMRKGH